MLSLCQTAFGVRQQAKLIGFGRNDTEPTCATLPELLRANETAQLARPGHQGDHSLPQWVDVKCSLAKRSSQSPIAASHTNTRRCGLAATPPALAFRFTPPQHYGRTLVSPDQKAPPPRRLPPECRSPGGDQPLPGRTQRRSQALRLDRVGRPLLSPSIDGLPGASVLVGAPGGRWSGARSSSLGAPMPELQSFQGIPERKS